MSELFARDAEAESVDFSGGVFENTKFLEGDFSKAKFDSARFSNTDFVKPNLIEGHFIGAHFSGFKISKAQAAYATFRDSVFEGAVLTNGYYVGADFKGATFRNTTFDRIVLTGARFDNATFVNCNLNRINVAGASFRNATITETIVYGVSAWDLKLDGLKQSKLVIEDTDEFYSDIIADRRVPLMVDDIELAQFVYYLSNSKRLRSVLTVLNTNSVLVLGRFRDGGMARLEQIREQLSRHGYLAMICDFERPDNLSLTETIVTMAGLTKFVVADLSGPSVPHELHAIFSNLSKPLLAIGGDPYSLFYDVEDKTSAIVVEHVSQIDGELAAMEQRHLERVALLADRDARREHRREGLQRSPSRTRRLAQGRPRSPSKAPRP